MDEHVSYQVHHLWMLVFINLSHRGNTIRVEFIHPLF